ncbi:MAG: OmpH family outer membrane protein [Myxococcales bacterium]|nr:MAG: OmpH family outer membrane protein [Myxococcales bacterium]
MARISLIVFAALALVVGVEAAAQAQAKVAYVDLQRALLEVEEGKNAKARLKVYFDEKQSLLDAESDRIKKLKEELERQDMMITPDAKAKKEEEFQKSLLEVQKLYMGLQNELKQKESEAVQPILDKMVEILKGVAEKDGYDLILDKNSSGIVYAPMKYDLTNELIRLYDEKYGKSKGKK